MARCSQGVAKVYPRCSQALGRLMSMPRVWLEAAWSMARVWLEYAYSMPTVCLETKNLFPYGEQNIPTLGKKHSQPGNKTGFLRPFSSKRAELERRLAANEITARCQRDYGSFITTFLLLKGRKNVVMSLLLLMLGVNTVWALESADYSGVYYIANNSSNSNRNYQGYDNASNYYLCPAHEYYDNGTIETTLNYNDTPFLTTYQTRQTDESLWIVEKVENTNYYTFKQKFGDNDYRYLTVNDAIASLGTNKTHRRRVHLEQTTEITDRNYFIIEPIETVKGINSYAICCLDDYKSGNNKYLNPPSGNYNQYTANGGDSGGIIGFYLKINNNKIETGSQWFFEVPKPIIHIDGNNNLSLTCANEDVTIHYTIDGEDPSATGTDDIYNATDNIQLTEGVHTIKAIAVMNNGNVGYASGLITQEVTVFSTEHPYLISNNQNPWTIGSETKNIFYLIPSDVSSGNTTVNTTSMPRPTMEWNIRYTGETDGELYLNIINAKTGAYLYRTGDNIYMKTPSEKTSLENDGDNGFKFYLIKRTDGYSIVPYGITNKYLNKNSGNTNKNAVNLSGTDNEYSQWNFVTKDEVLNDDILPFTSSDANTAVYYKIQNGNGDNYFIIPPTTNYATASDATDDATVKKMSWCFVKVEDPNDDDWLTYYKVVNAETGKALHYTEIANTSLNVGSYDDEDDNYKFAFVKSPTSNYYYIVPKAIKDDQLAQIPMIWRDNNALKKGATRGNSGNIWTFTQADIFCNDPVFEENAGSITISCVPDITRIYYTTDGTEPNPNDENQRYTNNTPFSASDQLLIKAIAFVSDGTNTDSSPVITLLNNPVVTLETGPYTYKGTAWEPSVTLSVGTTQTTTGFSTTYDKNINAGTETANVTITDADDTDVLYIWNVPVTYFSIDKAPLTIKANNKTIGYGDEPDNDGVTYNGFVGNPAETESVLGGTLSYSYTTSGDDPQPYTPFDAQYGNQGSYVITPSGLTSTNYDITFSTGVLTVAKKSIGDGALAEGFTLSFDEDGNVILEFGIHTLNKDVDYTIGNEVVGTKYSTRTLSGVGNYDGSVVIRNAIVHFTTDANQTEWSATFVAESSGGTDIGHALPEDIAAYIISDIEGTWAIPEPLEYIPAGVPVLLVTHEEKNGFLVKDASNVTAITPEQIAYNKLKRVTAESAHFNTKEIYVLYKNEFVLNKGGDLGNGKVYMENPNYDAPSPSPAPANLRIAWGNVTGIEDGRWKMDDGRSDRWYTLDGRCLIGKPTAKGLYIVNGKKRVVK